jgi:guanylate kinase
LEWAEVHGQFYGTLRREVDPFRQRGLGVFLNIDVQGAAQVRQRCPDSVSIFLRTSSWEIYEQRLRLRATEDDVEIQKRLAGARQELERAGEYDFQVINDNLATAIGQLHAIVKGQFERSSHAG